METEKNYGPKVLKEAEGIAESAQARQAIRDWPRKTRGVVLIAATTAVLITMAVCKGTPTTTTSTSTTTTTIPIPECEKNHTGTLKLENRSQRSLDYNVIIDNINYGRLKVGEIRSFELLTGMHTLDFAWADHVGYACGQSRPQIIECQTTWIYCDQ